MSISPIAQLKAPFSISEMGFPRFIRWLLFRLFSSLETSGQ
jgi:hypothetical protein